jgi:1-acyl-sn-glycerol-3-phosphate acyltransferase
MHQNWPYTFMKSLVSCYANLRFSNTVVIHAPIPTGPKILAVNHPTTIDPVMLMATFPTPVSIMISDTLFKVPILGQWLKYAGHIRIVHGQSHLALNQAAAVLKAGGTVAIFPEGAISPLQGFHPAHRGVARLALMSSAPVVPVGIAVEPRAIRQISTTIAGQREVGTWYFNGPYAVTIGKSMHFSGNPNDPALAKHLATQIMAQIEALSLEGTRRIHQHPAIPANNQSCRPSLR